MKNYSFTDILGPIMIGPSSSHTAGAAKLGRIAMKINNTEIDKIEFLLGGSFFETYMGHGTDKALLAGVLGFRPDDIRIRDSIEIAIKHSLNFEFLQGDLDNYHPNTVQFKFYNKDGSQNDIIGSSIGGGNIVINKINNFSVSFSGDLPTIIINHTDKKGVLSNITSILAAVGINIATMSVTRTSINKEASIIIETDCDIPNNVELLLGDVSDINAVKVINLKSVKEDPNV